MINYRKYVEDGLYKDTDNPFKLAIRQQIIGSDSFADRITREKVLRVEVKDKREQRALVHFQKSIGTEAVIKTVADFFNTNDEDILSRKGGRRLSRKVAVYMCCCYCTSHTSLTDIGKLFGVTLSGLTRTRDRVISKIETDKGLADCVKNIKKSIVEV